MRKMIRKKLNSKSGIAILYALLAFLAAAVFAAVIIAAALSGLMRVKDDVNEQQAHLTLLSAAQLVEEEIESSDYVRITTSTTVKPSTDPQDWITTEDADKLYAAEGCFDQELQKALDYISVFEADYTSNLCISVGSEDDLSDVNMTFRMKSSTDADEPYWIYCSFEIPGLDNSMYLTMTPDGTYTPGEGLSPSATLTSGEAFDNMKAEYDESLGFPKTGTTAKGYPAEQDISRFDLFTWGQAEISEVG